MATPLISSPAPTTREPHLVQFALARDGGAPAGPSHRPTDGAATDEADFPIVARPVVIPRPVGAEISWRERALQWRDDPRIVAGALGLVALTAGLFFYRSAMGTGDRSQVAPVATPVDAAASPTSSVATEVVVHVSGAVVAPGVYRLPNGARVGEAITLAGGPVEGAEPDRLNLAARLGDGQRVYIPRAGEPVPPDASGQVAGESAAGSPLNLNTATAAQLEALPGLGPSLAEAIITERDRRGGFQSVNDLLSVRGIGDRRLEDLKPLVVV